MGLRDQAKKAAASAAGMAFATSGLSSCNDNGAVDPLPPPLECSTVNAGQSLAATATRMGDTVQVTLTNEHPHATWQVRGVTNVVGATIAEIVLPEARTRQPLRIAFALDNPSTTTASFTLEAQLFGNDVTCDVQRTFTLTISGGDVQIALTPRDRLPLAARQPAEIVVGARDGTTVELGARTRYWGLYEARWSATDGELDRRDGPRVRWTLPSQPGVYQLELLLDYGADGLALDTLLLEVV